MENSIQQADAADGKPEWDTPEMDIETVASVTEAGPGGLPDGGSGS